MKAPPRQPGWVSAQGHYAGSVSRLLAYVVDIAVTTLLFTLGLAATAFIWQTLTGRQVSWSRSDAIVAVIFAGWQLLYFGYCWAVSGRTPGMAALGICVVRADGHVIDPWRGVLRALVFPLSFLLFGLGFLGILVQREHRALHDLIAGTAVIYSWDARAARLRFMARAAELGGRRPEPAGSHTPDQPSRPVAGTRTAASPGQGDAARRTAS
jgi:uncharacterized RDD family membrane protein YckC